LIMGKVVSCGLSRVGETDEPGNRAATNQLTVE
jgi:hypothetical protein